MQETPSAKFAGNPHAAIEGIARRKQVTHLSLLLGGLGWDEQRCFVCGRK
jgi:hypothetical protein